MGIKLAKAIMNESVIDAINFSDEYSIVEINVLDKWIGKPLEKLFLRDNYGMNVLCIKNANKDLEIFPSLEYTVEEIKKIISENNTNNIIMTITARVITLGVYYSTLTIVNILCVQKMKKDVLSQY
mgnify:CR=1 FL=1